MIDKPLSRQIRLHSFWVCLVWLLMMLGPGLFPETRRALLIGIDIYQPASETMNQPPSTGSQGRGSWQNLNGAVNDMKAMRDMLIARFGFKPKHIRILENGSAEFLRCDRF